MQPTAVAFDRQRGAAALVVTMLLFFAMVLVALFVNRNLVFEQRSSANQYRSTQAFEAAEAGLEWALAQLNLPERIGTDCLPSAAADAATFRERFLRYVAAGARFDVVDWTDAGVVVPLQAACVRNADGWACSCPQSGHPTPELPSGSGPFPAFVVRFQADPHGGTVRLQATGCSSPAGPCRPGSTTTADATARVGVSLGLLAGLRTAPAATLTTRAEVDVGAAPIVLQNTDPATGLVIDAGASVIADSAILTPPAGAPASTAIADHDAALAATPPERLFATYFGLPKSSWKEQPVVRQVQCAGDCSAALLDALGGGTVQLVWIDGAAQLAGPLTIGSAERPVVLVVAGSLALRGAVSLHGVVYADSLRWDATASGGATLRGALIGEGAYAGDGAPELAYDPLVLAALKGNSGSFARISGSWRDF